MLFDKARHPSFMRPTLRMVNAAVLKKGFDPCREGFFVVALHFVQVAASMKHGAAVSRGIKTLRYHLRLVIVAFSLSKLAYGERDITQSAQRASLDLARLLLASDSACVL